jgi:nucleotide-binding universal stress UspA family protein
MIEIKRILCPIDFSEHSRRALDNAVAIAHRYRAAVTVLHVLSPSAMAAFGPDAMVFDTSTLSSMSRDKILGDTKAFAETEGAPGIALDTIVREGNVAVEIVEQARDMNADLVVVGTHGRSGFERFVLGSVAEKVLRKASCPVLTVPTRVPDAVPAGPVLYRRILCPVDFSAPSLHALKFAASMAQQGGSQLTVLHAVAQEIEFMADIEYDKGMTVVDFVRVREETLSRRLREAVATAHGGSSVESVMTHGKPWREILRVAAERDADLIVIGVHGRGATDLLFMGSTTQHVVREASCPVLTLRSE